MSARVEDEKLNPDWLATWDWGDLDPEQAAEGAKILWDQVVDDVKQFGRPFIYVAAEPVIAVSVLGEAEHHIVIPLADITVTDERDRVAAIGALLLLAVKLAGREAA